MDVLRMELFKNKYRIGSKRLKGWDYSGAGRYFVTICTGNRVCYFGDVADGKMKLSPIGEIVNDEWYKTEQVRQNVKLDEFVVMPNHLHGIIVITNAVVETPRRGVSTETLKPNSLGSIICQFKSICTKRIWSAGFNDFAWQNRYYDSIIRNDGSLDRIRQYIVNNPIQWGRDRNNPNKAAKCTLV